MSLDAATYPPSARPVITGVGVVSPFGLGYDIFRDGLAADRVAITPIHVFDAADAMVKVAGQVPVSEIDHQWLTKALAVHDAQAPEIPTGGLRDRKLPFALLSAIEAWRAAGSPKHTRGAALSLGLGLEQALLADFTPLFEEGRIHWDAQTDEALPAIRYRAPLEGCADGVRALLSLDGQRVIHTSACASGAMALAHAAAWIRRGEAELVLAGASDSMVNPMGTSGMARLGAPSPRPDADACRPFDRHRDGLVIGEGAASFVVESLAHARARGAEPVAEILGWATTQDAHAVTAPRPDGARALAAMESALARAGRPAEAVDYVNAHGTGTPLNDPTEAKAIRALFGAHADTLAVSSIKGAIGHLMAAAGAVELAACVAAIETGVLPGTAHLEEIDAECPINVLDRAQTGVDVAVTLSNSFGFGGQNCAVVLGRLDP